MTVLLVLFTFITFLAIDHFYGRKQVVIQSNARPSGRTRVARVAPNVVSGFQVLDNLRYHPGHTWALSESPNLVRVGMDDFASKLVGKVDSITLPQRGQWLRQGQKVCTLHRDGSAVEMVSPIEGTVSDINEAVARNSDLAQKDPYGEGWLITVHSPDAKTNFRNLLGGTLARWWTEESANRLRAKLTAFAGAMPAGALAQDGGVAVENAASQIPDQDWAALAKEFFLS